MPPPSWFLSCLYPILANRISFLPPQLGSDEDILSSWPSSAGPVEAAFGTLLEHLNREGLSKQQAEEIGALPLVPVANATHLAAATHVFFRLPGDLSPFAYEVPVALSSHAAVLRQLGAKDETSVQVGQGGNGWEFNHAVGKVGSYESQISGSPLTPTLLTLQALLEALHLMASRVGGQPLNANECVAVMRLLQHLAGGEEEGGGRTAAGQAAAPKRSAADLSYLRLARSQGRLLVLTADARWVPSHPFLRPTQ